MSDIFAPTLADLIAYARFEVAMRKRGHPGSVARGRMTQGQAEREIALMRGILERLDGEAARG